MRDWITITNGILSAAINPLGAELSSLRDADGRELMTDADPKFWGGRAPILFPIVGALAGDTLRLDGKRYQMGKHGFARGMTFTVSEHHDDWAAFTLETNTETRRMYPREFTLRIEFRIVDTTLHVEVDLWNSDRERSLPASFGFHPAFAWPLPYGRDRADHRIAFAADEGETIRILSRDGTLAPEPRPSPLTGRTLHLADDLFTRDALIWDAVRSDRVIYGANDGPQLEVAFPDTPALGIWTKPGSRFVCIEPWHGIADPQGYSGDFRAKPLVFEIAPGASKHIAMSITLRA